MGGNPGCVTCHSLEAGVTLVGPSLDRVESPIPGLSVAEYVRQSIVAPDNHVVSGFAEGQMPGNWEVLLTPEQIESLVSLLAKDG